MITSVYDIILADVVLWNFIMYRILCGVEEFFCLTLYQTLVKLKANLFVCELCVDSSEGIGASFNVGLVLGVEVYLKDTLSINLAADTLSSDFSWVNDILEDGVLYSSESTGARTKTGSLVRTSIALSKDGTLCNNQDVTSRELLFKFTNKTLVDLVEAFEEFVRNVKDDCLASTSNINFLSSGDEKVTKRSLQFGGSHLQVKKLLSDVSFELIRFLFHK